MLLRVPRCPARSWPPETTLLVARMVVRLASSPALLNFSHGFRVFSFDHGHPDSISSLPDAPGLGFGGRNALIFVLFRRFCVFGVNFVRYIQNIGRSYIFHTSELPHEDTKTAKNRSAGSFDHARCSECTQTPFWAGPGTSWDHPGDPFGRLLAALRPWRPQIGLGAIFGRPRAVPSAS